MKSKTLISLLPIFAFGLSLSSCKGNGGNNSDTKVVVKDVYTVSVASESNAMGTVTGSGSYEEGSQVIITATPNEGLVFDAWYDGDTLVSTDSDYLFNMPSHNINFVARFEIASSDTGSTFTFGTYPQTRVTDVSITSKLFSKVKDIPTSTNNKNWTPFNWYINSSNETKFAWYIDVDMDGDSQNDYRGVYFTSYRPFNSTWESGEDKTYQLRNGYEKSVVYWFSYDPLTWRILSSSNNEHFVMSNKIVDSVEYSFFAEKGLQEKTDYQGNTGLVYPNNYKYSGLRKFLNVNFYNQAFTDLEKNKVLTTDVNNSQETTLYKTNIYACGNTSDKVFAPSASELLNESYGFSKEYATFDPARKLKLTDYALCLGEYRFSDENDGNGNFLMRSPDKVNSFSVSAVYGTGYANGYYHSVVPTGVVPAMRIE